MFSIFICIISKKKKKNTKQINKKLQYINGMWELKLRFNLIKFTLTYLLIKLIH